MRRDGHADTDRMAVPRLAVLLIAGVLLIPAAFLVSRQAAGSGEDEAPPPRAPAEATAQASPPTAPGKSAIAPGSSKSEAKSPQPGAGRKSTARSQRKVGPATQGRKKAAAAGLPAAVARALAKKQTVVLLLTDGNSADDRATTKAVRSLKGRAPKTRVFRDRLKNLGSYRAIVGRVGVSQSPAVIIVRGTEARVVEGYVDPQTLLQQVLDVRR